MVAKQIDRNFNRHLAKDYDIATMREYADAGCSDGVKAVVAKISANEYNRIRFMKV